MIVDILQTKTNFDMEWVIQEKNEQVALAHSPFEYGRFQVFLEYQSGNKQRLYYNPSDVTWGKKFADRLSFKLFEKEDIIGHMVGRTRKVGFLKAYAYYEYLHKGQMYYGYEVGFGKNGLYLCVYREDQLIAIVDKQLRVVNFKDVYTAYIENAEDIEIVIPFVIYYDATAYGDVMEVAVMSVREKRVNTIQKELIEKYDANFIFRIITRDGIVE